MPRLTIGVSDAKTNFSKLSNEVAETGVPVTIYKNKKPFVVLSPASTYGITNRETLASMEESDLLIHNEGHRFYNGVQDFMDALNRAAENA